MKFYRLIPGVASQFYDATQDAENQTLSGDEVKPFKDSAFVRQYLGLLIEEARDYKPEPVAKPKKGKVEAVEPEPENDNK